MQSVVIRDGTPADHGAAEAIQRVAFSGIQWRFGVGDRFKVAHLASGEMVGYLIWRQTFSEEFEILSIATHPKHRREGVGRALINELCAANRGDLFLEVRESNHEAIAFYEALGFEKAGTRGAYYADSGEGASVMKLHFGY